MIKLSVCMITYNHENFIAQAIESVLMQKTNFDFELVIGEDFSIDRTREICISYKRKYPEKINLILNEKNLGMIPNFINTIHQCKGEYIALLEGDDYWTDPYKLQKQVDFLETNLDFSICAHKVKVLINNKLKEDNFLRITPKISTQEHLARGNYLRTLSVVVRFPKNKKFVIPQGIRLGDHFSWMYISQYGKIMVLDEIMGVYRYHSKGNWSGAEKKTKIEEIITHYDVLADFFKKQPVYKLLKGTFVYRCLMASIIYLRKGKITKGIKKFLYSYKKGVSYMHFYFILEKYKLDILKK